MDATLDEKTGMLTITMKLGDYAPSSSGGVMDMCGGTGGFQDAFVNWKDRPLRILCNVGSKTRDAARLAAARERGRMARNGV